MYLCNSTDALSPIWQEVWQDKNFEEYNDNSLLCEMHDTFVIGESNYKFINGTIKLNYYLLTDEWQCHIDRKLSLFGYFGVAQTREGSFEDLKLKIHIDFQKIIRMRPFEMSDTDRSKWEVLANFIDLLQYNISTPIVVREIGRVSFGQIARPDKIIWITGKNYKIDPTKMPDELWSCKPGQWIEAIVKRDPITYREIRIDSISKISDFRIQTKSQVKKFIDTLPKIDSDNNLEW